MLYSRLIESSNIGQIQPEMCEPYILLMNKNGKYFFLFLLCLTTKGHQQGNTSSPMLAFELKCWKRQS